MPGGTAPIVAIGWHCSSTSSAYMHKEFVDKCVDEIDKVAIRAELGQPSNPLEQLAIQLLMESAYVENFKGLTEAIKRQKEFDERQVDL